MSNQYNSYNKAIRQQTLQTSPIYKFNSPYDQSPFKKGLAVIPESQVGDERMFHIQKVDSVIQSSEFLCQSYSSHLYGSGGLNKQQSGQIVSPFIKENSSNKQLFQTHSMQQKQSQLKQLQNQLLMIKNTNECLRDTIKQNNMQRERLVEEVEAVRRQNKEYVERIARLEEELARANQQLLGLRQPQDEKYFLENSIIPKSQEQFIQENECLKQSIQELKRMYEREIDIMVVKHGKEVVGLESKWSALVKQKDILIKEMEKRLQQRQKQMNKKLDELKQQVSKLTIQKKQLLSEYLQTIQSMRHEFKQSIKTQLNSPSTISNPILISQPYILDCQPTRDNIPIDQCNQLSPAVVSDLNNTTINYIGERFNRTMLSDHRRMSRCGDHEQVIIMNNSSFIRQLSKQRENSQHKKSSSKLSHLLYTSKNKLNSASNMHLSIPSRNTTSINSKLLRDIDNKLDRIKYQINKEITY